MKKSLLLATGLLALLGFFFYSQKIRSRESHIVTATESSAQKKSKKESPTIDGRAQTNNFYQGAVYPVNAELKLANYPTTFAELLQSGDVSFQGTVTDLKGYVSAGSPAAPYTMALIKVERVLAGNVSYRNSTLKVVFSGGNISKKLLLRDVAIKDYWTPAQKAAAKSGEVVTVKNSYSPLPKIGATYAIIASWEPAGQNGIPEKFLMPCFAGKGVFIKQRNGSYRRESTQDTNPDQQAGITTVETADDAMMNQGMTALF